MKTFKQYLLESHRIKVAKKLKPTFRIEYTRGISEVKEYFDVIPLEEVKKPKAFTMEDAGWDVLDVHQRKVLSRVETPNITTRHIVTKKPTQTYYISLRATDTMIHSIIKTFEKHNISYTYMM